jgi:hypothetical protein
MLTWHDRPGSGRENKAAKAGSSQGGKSNLGMPRVASCKSIHCFFLLDNFLTPAMKDSVAAAHESANP